MYMFILVAVVGHVPIDGGGHLMTPPPKRRLNDGCTGRREDRELVAAVRPHPGGLA